MSVLKLIILLVVAFGAIFGIGAIGTRMNVYEKSGKPKTDNKKTPKSTKPQKSQKTEINKNSSWYKRNETAIALAANLIEQGYRLAGKIKIFDPALLKLMQSTVDGKIEGFVVVVFTDEPYSSAAEVRRFYDEYVDMGGLWKIGDFNGDIIFNLTWQTDITCTWNKFNQAVWSEVKEKHPDWKYDYINSPLISVDLN